MDNPSFTMLDSIIRGLEPHHCRLVRQDEWRARCPVHGGNDRDSLTVSYNQATGKILIHCHSKGCAFHEVLDALGVEAQGVFLNAVGEGLRYEYVGPDGTPIHAQVRGRGKRFHAEHWAGNGWQRGAPEDRLWMVPYRLPEVIYSISQGETIWFTEGEKDADVLALHGLSSTTIANGSSGWREHYAQWFRGAKIVMIPDRDEPGQKLRSSVEQALRGICESFQVVDLPYEIAETGGKDVYDWIMEGHTVDELKSMADSAWRLDGVITLSEAANEDNWFDAIDPMHFEMTGLGPGYQIPGIGPGVFLIFGARLGVGKTAWVVDLLSRIMTQAPALKIMMSTYDEPATRIRQYLAASIEMDHRYTDWRMPKRHRRHHKDCRSLTGKNVLLDTRPRGVDGIEHIARSWRPDIIVVDHLGMIQGGADQRERLEDAAKRLRTLANDLPCCVIGLSQFNRLGEDLGELATSSNLYGSDAIGHNADAILGLQRPMPKRRGRIHPKLQLENIEEIANINEWEQYRVLHTIKNRMGPEMGVYPVRLAGAIRRIYPLHKNTCNCRGCVEFKHMIKVVSQIEQEITNVGT